ncbi:uncharacterized protein LOC132942645 [Metopolophium dirhodum]|uniref:uncharacterized protein LOC132942645 n=1 Tax=Metopolophium dirhodum TaxID=44670 RepID=UPI00299006B9|nr:uncharacterized protein LOC132942645 [Metopolophium dirhodum]
MEFVKSAKGNNLLVYRGFLYSREKPPKNDETIWKCVESKNVMCRARVHTNGEEITKVMNVHSHPPDPAKISGKRIFSKLKQLSMDVGLSTHTVVANVCQDITPGVSSVLPSISSLKRNVRRYRVCLETSPSNPSSLEDLIIPEKYLLTTGKKPFMLYDSGKEDPQRLLIFSTKENLELLTTCDHWYADGTFSSSPPLFSQIYTIHGAKFSTCLPLVYALLPNKTQATYTKFRTALKVLNSSLKPSTLMIDFEKAVQKSVNEVFPECLVRGCYFHFSQSIWRHIQSSSLQQRYMNDAEFALEIRQIAALAFIPEEAVENAFKTLIESEFYENNGPELAPLLNYFEDTWLGRLDRRGRRRSPIFPLSMWNCFTNVSADLPRTNNGVEGWHNTLYSLLHAAHPSIWKVINAFKQDENLTKVKIKGFIQGKENASQKKRYQLLDARIESICSKFEETPTLDYLRGIAHNLQFNV